jgi:hypothetical protein
MQSARLVVDRLEDALEEPDVALLGADGPQEPGDVAGVQAGGRDLVQQRVERVVRVTVDQGDVDVSALELADGGDAAESTPDDHHMRTLAVGHGGSHGHGSSLPA